MAVAFEPSEEPLDGFFAGAAVVFDSVVLFEPLDDEVAEDELDDEL